MVIPLIAAPCVSEILGTSNVKVCDFAFSVMDCFALYSTLNAMDCTGGRVNVLRSSPILHARGFFSIFSLQLVAASTTLIVCLYCYVFFTRCGTVTLVRDFCVLNVVFSAS